MIIIVAHNNLHYTKRALRSALAQTPSRSIVLIDNGSTDGTFEWAASLTDKIQLVIPSAFGPTRSLAACWNIGLTIAWQGGHKHALIINNDVELRPDTYSRLEAEGDLFVTGVSVRTKEELDRPLPPTLSWSVHPDFSCFLIRKEVTDRAGWFNETYHPAYCEDCDFHVRLHRASIPAYSISLPFLHHGSGTLTNADPNEAAAIRRAADRNRAKFKAEYGCEPGTPEYQLLFTPLEGKQQ